MCLDLVEDCFVLRKRDHDVDLVGERRLSKHVGEVRQRSTLRRHVVDDAVAAVELRLVNAERQRVVRIDLAEHVLHVVDRFDRENRICRRQDEVAVLDEEIRGEDAEVFGRRPRRVEDVDSRELAGAVVAVQFAELNAFGLRHPVEHSGNVVARRDLDRLDVRAEVDDRVGHVVAGQRGEHFRWKRVGHADVALPLLAGDAFFVQIVEAGDERIPESFHVIKNDRLLVIANGGRCCDGEDFVECADTSWKRDEKVALGHHQRLPVVQVVAWNVDVHVLTDVSVLLDFRGNDADDLSTGCLRSVGNALHETHVGTSENDGMTVLGQTSAQFPSQMEIIAVDVTIG